jgi:hypothetical protein
MQTTPVSAMQALALSPTQWVLRSIRPQAAQVWSVELEEAKPLPLFLTKIGIIH